MTKSEGRKSFSIDALLARTTTSSASSKSSSSNYGNGMFNKMYENEDRGQNGGDVYTHNNNNNNDTHHKKGSPSQNPSPNMHTGQNSDRVREIPINEDDRENRNIVSSSSLSPVFPGSNNVSTRESKGNPDLFLPTPMDRDFSVRKGAVSPQPPKEVKSSDGHFLHKSREELIRHKQESSNPFHRHHADHQNLSLLLAAQQQQLKRSSMMSSSPTSPPASSPSSSSPLSAAEKAARHQDTPGIHSSGPHSLLYPGDLRLGQFPVHPFHSHLRPHNLPGQVGTPRPAPQARSAIANRGSGNSNSLDNNLIYRHHVQNSQHDLQKFKDKLNSSPISPDRPTSGGKSRSPAPSPRSAHSVCSSPRSHTPESPALSPKGSMGGSDRGPPSSIRACSPSPQRHSPSGGVPAAAGGGFIPRPGLLGLPHHGLVSSAGHLGFQVSSHVSRISSFFLSLYEHRPSRQKCKQTFIKSYNCKYPKMTSRYV